MSETDDSVVKQLKSLVEKWHAEHDKEGYEPLDFLSRLSCLLEEQATQFYKGDPDPFDDRHPEYIQPGCSYGKLLVALVKYEDLLDKVTATYLRVKSQHSMPAPVAIGAARVLLAAMPGLELSVIFNANDWIIDLLVNWAKNMDEPMRTYATGLLVGALERMESIFVRTNTLFPILLDRLCELLNNYKKRKSIDDDKENCRNPTAKIVSDKNVVDNTSPDPCKRASKRIKLNSDVPTVENEDNQYYLPNSSISTKLSNDIQICVTDGAENGICRVQESQSSSQSWSEQMSVVVGYSYSLKPPLSSDVCQGIILDFLKCLGEYQDLLSVFLEKKALDMIEKYLTGKTYDGLLTFKALKFLASLLCHNKVVTEFVETNGIQKLLSVRRPSMGSTGVSLCLYFIGCKRSAMDRVCQLPHKVLVKMVKYAIWLLDCSHESGRCHAALFFSVSFSYRFILDIFDDMNGLRCLMNMVSTFPPVVNFPIDEEELADTDLDGSMQTPRTVCITLKKYFEAHLLIKATSVQKSHRTEESYLPLQSIPHYKAVECSRDQFFLYLDFLREEMASNDVWKPILKFMALDGLTLLSKVFTIVCIHSNFSGRLETIRSILDVFAVTSLLSKVKYALCSPLITNLNTKNSGICMVLQVVDGYRLSEGEAQKSALATILNCVCGNSFTKESSTAVSSKHSHKKLSARNHKEMQEKIWKCVKNNNGIKTLLSMLVVTEPANQADELRLLACKALVGLSKYQPVTQIISKLPIFINGQIQIITREPVLHDKRHLHAKLCRYLESLLEQVSGKPNFFDIDTDMLRKSWVVSKTPIRFNNKELLQLIHNHLVWSGLQNSARILAQEATITPLSIGSSSALESPLPHKHKNSTNTPTTPTSRHSAKSRFKESLPISSGRKISFTRGDHAQAETPSPSTVISPSILMLKKSRLRKLEQGNAVNAQSQFHLSSSGHISSVRKKSYKSNKIQSSNLPATLNSIVEEHLKRQHARCSNPVVTVPEFSLLRPHKCPEPRYRLQAPINVTLRVTSRQNVQPPWGGQGGASADRKLIFSRFKPSYVFRGAEDRKIPLSCAAFTYGGAQLLLGDVEGNLIGHSIRSEETHMVEGIAGSPLTAIAPAKVQDAVLLTAEGIWSTTCSLYKMNEQYEHKLTFNDVTYVEFSNILQDKVIGSNQHKATVFDLHTGQVVNTYECEDLASEYLRNCATFSPDNNLILSDGLLWDVRQSTTPIHKFDKFNNLISGVFHPRGLEVLINTEIWDLRNFNLLHTIPALDQCTVVFNEPGTIIYAVKYESEERDSSEKRPSKMSSSSFRTIDAFDYEQIALIDARHKICDIAVDSIDHKVAVVERIDGHGDELWADTPQTGICRLFEVGVPRGEEDEEDDKSESSESIFSADSSSHTDEENNDVEEMDSDDQYLAASGTDSDGWETIDHSEDSDNDNVF